jgi:magnesium-transporting ATPase (P-type)
VRRDGQFAKIDVVDLVVGDVIRLALGEAVPADVRLIEVTGLECAESILSGESTAALRRSLDPNRDGGTYSAESVAPCIEVTVGVVRVTGNSVGDSVIGVAAVLNSGDCLGEGRTGDYGRARDECESNCGACRDFAIDCHVMLLSLLVDLCVFCNV